MSAKAQGSQMASTVKEASHTPAEEIVGGNYAGGGWLK